MVYFRGADISNWFVRAGKFATVVLFEYEHYD